MKQEAPLFKKILHDNHLYMFNHALGEQITTNKLDTRIQECSMINLTGLIYIYIATVNHLTEYQ